MRKNYAFILFLLCFLFTAAFAEAACAPQAGDRQAAVKNESVWILINVPARWLRLYDGDTCIAMYPVGVGKIESKTPAGYYKVVEKIMNPTWTDPSDLEKVIPSGPDNPLGYCWIGIGGNYGIHGTNKPSSVGHYVSNGCVRMVEENVEKVFDMVSVGTPVQIIYNRLVIDKTPDKRVAYYIYPDGYGAQELTADFVKAGLKGYGLADFISDERIKESIKKSDGQPNYVAAPVNIVIDKVKAPFKAVNYENVIYVPVLDLAKNLNSGVKLDKDAASTAKGSAKAYYFSKKPYIHAADLEKLFDWTADFNKDYSVMTLTAFAVKGENADKDGGELSGGTEDKADGQIAGKDSGDNAAPEQKAAEIKEIKEAKEKTQAEAAADKDNQAEQTAKTDLKKADGRNN